MKKYWYIPMVTGLLAMTLCVPAQAEAQLDYVTDAAGLLTEEETLRLNETAAEIAETYDCAPYIVTMQDYNQLENASDVEAAAESLYLGYELGAGEQQSGILLLLSMAERDYALYAYGYGTTAFTDYGREYLADTFLPDFGDDQWYDGFATYLATCDDMIWKAQEGKAVDVSSATEPHTGLAIGICVVLSFLIAFVVRTVLVGQLKSVKAGTQAGAFVSGGGLTLSEREDRYLYTTVSRIYDPPQESNSSGGGSTINSSGGSSSSGKF